MTALYSSIVEGKDTYDNLKPALGPLNEFIVKGARVQTTSNEDNNTPPPNAPTSAAKSIDGEATYWAGGTELVYLFSFNVS